MRWQLVYRILQKGHLCSHPSVSFYLYHSATALHDIRTSIGINQGTAPLGCRNGNVRIATVPGVFLTLMYCMRFNIVSLQILHTHADADIQHYINDNVNAL